MKKFFISISALVRLGEVSFLRIREVVGLPHGSRGSHALPDVGDETWVVLFESGDADDVQNLHTGRWLGLGFLSFIGRISQCLPCQRLVLASLCYFSFAVGIAKGEFGLGFELPERCRFCEEEIECLSVLSFSPSSYR